ncbi:MAG: bifunctional hydroxymethylpyrimidine kinase/phosphomethylpyrimidine kinase [Bacillota bacterium]|nr:bifunctional hydroxymethylpyrimidine kinase/phosphomethylpyrimidine kinase [Bacillota bacterium]
MTIPRALTVAGSDSGGGAGIQADLKAFLASGVYGLSVITAVTAQNTVGVQGVVVLEPSFVRLQLQSVMEDIGADAVKTGMLATGEIIQEVAATMDVYRVERLVVDPVMVAKSGDRLLDETALLALREDLLPKALVATPNLPEAEALLEMEIRSPEAMEKAARLLHGMGVKYAVIKGGHLEGAEALDVVFDGKEIRYLRAPRYMTPHTHGTGCTFASAIAAGLARGMEPLKAIEYGKRFITEAIAKALPLGQGKGPTNPGGLVREVP